jgi:uncharacterized oxidoreductase
MRAGMAFTAFVNVADHPDAQALWACAGPRLSTNPFCAAVPGAEGSGPGVMLDMATTTIAAGKVRVAYNKGVPVQDGVLIDANGQLTNDPTSFMCNHTGGLLSFGRHKGSGLAIMCKILAGAIAGGQRADEPRHGGIVNSMLAVVIDLSQLGDTAAIAQSVEATKVHIRSSRVAPGFDEILLPGEPERLAADQRARRGSRSMRPSGTTFARLLPRRARSIARSVRIRRRIERA